jgi:hypothetical protein
MNDTGYGEALARRATGILVMPFLVTIAMTVIMIILTFVSFIKFNDSGLLVLMIGVTVLLAATAVVCEIRLMRTPRVLAELKCGEILLHPKKYQTVRLMPEEITCVYASKGLDNTIYGLKYGTIVVQSKGGTHKLRWCENVDEVCNIFEKLAGKKSVS